MQLYMLAQKTKSKSRLFWGWLSWEPQIPQLRAATSPPRAPSHSTQTGNCSAVPGTLVVLIMWCGESGLGSDGSPDLWVMDKWGGGSLWAGWLRPRSVLRALLVSGRNQVYLVPTTSTGRNAASKHSTVSKAFSLKAAHPSSSKRVLGFLSQTS